MKKSRIHLIFVSIISLLLLLSGCGEKVVSLKTVIDNEEPIMQNLQGMERKTLKRSWGEPVASTESYDLWESDGKFVQAWYEDDISTSIHRSCTMRVKVLEVSGNTALTEPEEGQWERNSADRIFIPLSALYSDGPASLSWGDILEIE